MSEEKHIDEFFKSVLDKPVEGVNPMPAWEKFEAMKDASDASKSTGSVYKASMLGAIASFLFLSIVSIVDKPLETVQQEVFAENVAPLSIVRFDQKLAIDAQMENESQLSESPNKNELVASVAENQMESSTENIISKTTIIPSLTSNEIIEASDSKQYFEMTSKSGNELLALREMQIKDLAFADGEQMAIQAMEFEENDFEKAVQLGPKNALSLIVASNKFDGIISNSNNSSDNGVQSIGLEYQRRISTKMALSLGLMYSHSNMNGFQNNYDSVAYSFGSTTYRTSIKSAYTKSLHMPVAFSYRPSAKHEIGVGAELSYLLDVNSEVNQAILGHESETAVLREYRSGYRQGFSDFHANALMSYRYQLTQAIQFGLTGRFALSDRIDKAYFDEQRDLKPFYWQVQINYNLRKF